MRNEGAVSNNLGLGAGRYTDRLNVCSCISHFLRTKVGISRNILLTFLSSVRLPRTL
jgi:hypothetical protein